MLNFFSRKRLATPVIGVAALALALTACAATPEPEAPAEPVTMDQISIQVVPTTDSLVAYIAQEEGIFEKHGLEVDLSIGQGGAAIAAALQSGGADIGIINNVSLLSGTANNFPLQAIAGVTIAGDKDPGVYVMADGPIKSVADLKGKNIGVPHTGSLADLTTNVQLNSAGIAPDEVTYVTLPMANLVAALTSGQVDAVVLDQPISQAATAEGGKHLVGGFSGDAEGLPVASFVAAKDWIAANAGVLEKFRAAIAEAGEVLSADTDAALALLPTYTAITPDQFDELELPSWDAEVRVDDLQRLADLMLEYGLLTQELDASTAVAK